MVRFGLIFLALGLTFSILAKPVQRCAESLESEIARAGAVPRRELIPAAEDGKFFAPHLIDPNVEMVRRSLTPSRGVLRYFAMSACGKLTFSVVDHADEEQLLSLHHIVDGGLKPLYQTRWLGSPIVAAAVSASISSIAVVTESDFVMVGSFDAFFSNPSDLPSIALRSKNEWFAQKGEKPVTFYVGFAENAEDEDRGDYTIAVVSALTVFHFLFHPEKETLKRHRLPTRLMLPHYTASPVQGVTVHDQSLRLGVWRASTFVEVLRYNREMRRYEHDPQVRQILKKTKASSK